MSLSDEINTLSDGFDHGVIVAWQSVLTDIDNIGYETVEEVYAAIEKAISDYENALRRIQEYRNDRTGESPDNG